MYKHLIAGAAFAAALSLSATAWAFACPNSFDGAQAAIDSATAAVNKMPDGDKKGLVHTLIDDAKTQLTSGKHNHEKAAAGGYDHARAVAKARAAQGYAEAAQILAES